MAIDYILVSEIFPPAVGGSGVLLENVYRRISNARVTALVDSDPHARDPSAKGHMELIRVAMGGHGWGVFDPRGWPAHASLARRIYALGARGAGIVHCGRAQPEGIPAMLASLFPGGPPFLFWAHGEDISAALSSRQYARSMRLVYRRAAAAIANSRNTAALIQNVGWLRGPVHVVYPGVDAQRFCPSADDGTLKKTLAPRGELLLLSVARLQKRKGHELVLRALPDVLREFPGVRYVIVGVGAERTRLQEVTRDLHLNDSVIFTGEVPDTMLPAYFAASDIFVLPTRVEQYDFEGFGIVFLEAAAAEKASIGGRNGGVPEAIVEGETGLLVSGESVSELTVALQTLCRSRNVREQMGRTGRQRALRDFTWDQAARAVSALHEDIARSRRQRSVN